MLKNISMPAIYNKNGVRWKIFICCLLFIGVGIINSLWTHLDYKSWYEALKKPLFSPPSSSLVGIIWTLMYISMGFSVGKIWQIAQHSIDPQIAKLAKKGIWLFAIQIMVNMIVPIFFFAVHNLYFLLTAVIVNFFLVLGVVQHFYKVNKNSAYILIPYSVWLLYAIILDSALLILN